MQAFGWPVVPEVNASRQMSSAAVSAFTKRSEAAAIRASRSPFPQVMTVDTPPAAA